jgi:lysine 6-dehydrogenase
MKRYLVLGSGLQGRIVAYDLLAHDKGCEVILADVSEENLAIARNTINNDNLKTEVLDVFNVDATAALMKGVDVAINSLPHTWNYTESFYNACIKSGTNGVITDYWEWKKMYAFDDQLKKAGALVIPGLGIVPGFGNICIGQLAYEFEQLEEGAIYCGGLPVETGKVPLDYMILFNVESLLDLYLTDAEIIMDGDTSIEKHLENIETILIPGIGPVEAVKTDGLYSLNKTMKEKGVKKLYETTCRYPGHYQAIKQMEELGFFDKEPIEVDGVKIIPRQISEAILNKRLQKVPGVRDFTYLLVTGKGLKDGKYVQKSYELMDYSDEKAGITSMERTTAYPASIAAMIVANDNLGMTGVVEPERIFVGPLFEKMVKELAKRGIIVYEK